MKLDESDMSGNVYKTNISRNREDRYRDGDRERETDRKKERDREINRERQTE